MAQAPKWKIVNGETLRAQAREMMLRPERRPMNLRDAGAPRLDLDGFRVKNPGQPQIYLVDMGYKRWVPDPDTFDSLFRDWNGVLEDTGVDAIPTGLPIQHGAVLIKSPDADQVYLSEYGTKRWIVSPEVFDRFNFSWDNIQNIPNSVIAALSNGPAIVRTW
jgi:hypothetical protein